MEIKNVFSFVSGAIAKPFNMLLKEVKEFCSETSIHGLGQVANDKLSILKRLLWFGIFAGCIAYAGTQLFSSIKGTVQSRFSDTFGLRKNCH